jgi:hypothetical protein
MMFGEPLQGRIEPDARRRPLARFLLWFFTGKIR